MKTLKPEVELVGVENQDDRNREGAKRAIDVSEDDPAAKRRSG